MKPIEYFTVQRSDSVESILKRLDKEYRLSNMYPAAKPIQLMGNAKVLELRVSNRKINIKVDGPGFIIEAIYNRLLMGER